MNTMTMDRINAVIQAANQQLDYLLEGSHRFAATENCTVTNPVLQLVDRRGAETRITTIMAHALDAIIAADCFLAYVQSVTNAATIARESGHLDGRLEAQREMRRALGVVA